MSKTELIELADDFKTVGDTTTEKEVIMKAKDCCVFYDDNQALKNINIEVGKKEVLSLIGPSGCGKSTFIRCLNRLNDTIDSAKVTGEITLENIDIYHGDLDVVLLRARVGMVFQKPNPFPKSVYENIAYGPRIHGMTESKSDMDEIVETSLLRAGLWEEVKDRLNTPGTALSGGQQQRLCIARALAIQSLCCCPPESAVPGVFNLSLTSSHKPALNKEVSTISSISDFDSVMPWILGP